MASDKEVLSSEEASSKKTSSKKKKWIFLLLKLTILTLVIYFVSDTLVDGVHKLRTEKWEPHYGWLLLSGLFYLLGLAFDGLYWWFVLRRLGQHPGLFATYRAYYIGHLGKYVPGKAMVIILRTALLQRKEISTGIVAASVFFDTLTMMAVGSCLAAVVIFCSHRGDPSHLWGAIGLFFAAGVPTFPPIFRRLALLAGVGKRDADVREKMSNFNLSILLPGWGIMVLVWSGLALSLYAALLGIGCEVTLQEHFLLCLGTVALAVVGGFLSLLPGGVGVREAVVLALLVSPQATGIDAGQAILAAMALRIIWLLAELFIAGLLAIKRGTAT